MEGKQCKLLVYTTCNMISLSFVDFTWTRRAPLPTMTGSGAQRITNFQMEFHVARNNIRGAITLLYIYIYRRRDIILYYVNIQWRTIRTTVGLLKLGITDCEQLYLKDQSVEQGPVSTSDGARGRIEAFAEIASHEVASLPSRSIPRQTNK